MNLGIFTIIAKNYLAQARVLMRSVRQWAPDAKRFVILVDQPDGYFQPEGEPFTIVPSSELKIPNSAWFHFKYTVLELSTAVKPYAMEYLLNRYNLDVLIYFDPDIRCYAPLDQPLSMLEDGNILLTPHLTHPLDDGMSPGDLEILRSGCYNLGFIGVRRSGTTEHFLRWWQDKLYDYCVVDIPRGLFVDQRWVDLVPGLFDGVRISRDPGMNVAYWNIPHRRVELSAGGYLSNGQPLRFFHFSGFDAMAPESFSRHQNRYRLDDLGDARKLLLDYREELLAEGHQECRQWPYTYNYFRNGKRIPDIGRPIHHEAPELTATLEDPFSDGGHQAFLALWNQPVAAAANDCQGITRLAYRIYRTRTDVQAAMPDVLGADRLRFVEWMLVSGKREHKLDDEFLTPMWEALRNARRSAARSRSGQQASPPTGSALWPRAAEAMALALKKTRGSEAEKLKGLGINDLIAGDGKPLRWTPLARAIYESRPDVQTRMPDPLDKDAAQFLTWFLTYGAEEYALNEFNIEPLRAQWGAVLASLPAAGERIMQRVNMAAMQSAVRLRRLASEARSIFNHKPKVPSWQRSAGFGAAEPASNGRIQPVERGVGLNLVGHFTAETGVGESVRSALEASRAVGMPVNCYALLASGPQQRRNQPVELTTSGAPYAVSVFHMNADETPSVFDSGIVSNLCGNHNIGYWAWELEEFPDRFLPAFTYYNEIWTPSSFCLQAIGSKSPIPVYCIPHAVEIPQQEPRNRTHFGLDDSGFLFLTAFDMLSIFNRKNPLAVIQAFRSAFRATDGCLLVVKVNHAECNPKAMDQLREAAAGHQVRILAQTLTRQEMYSLLGCCDCFVSLHRSEGFGLMMAEAMYLGKPVIATGYSGNLDFTKADNALLVTHKMCPVGPGCDPYPPDSLWADPDIDHAAQCMKRIHASPEQRSRLAAAGRSYVRANLSRKAVGNRIAARVEEIMVRLAVSQET